MGWRPLPGREPDRLVRAGDGVDQVLRHLGAPSRGALNALFTRWSELVGPRVAEHAELVGIADGRLTVRVDDPAWASQIRWLEQELVTRAAAIVGPDVVSGIDVRVGGAEPRGRPSSRRRRGR